MVGTTGDVKEPSGHESKISAHLKSHEDELGWSIQMNRGHFYGALDAEKLCDDFDMSPLFLKFRCSVIITDHPRTQKSLKDAKCWLHPSH